MPGSYCSQSRELRADVRAVVRAALVELERAPLGEREAVAGEALVALHRIRLEARTRLPADGCGGRRCLEPALRSAEQRLDHRLRGFLMEGRSVGIDPSTAATPPHGITRIRHAAEGALS